MVISYRNYESERESAKEFVKAQKVVYLHQNKKDEDQGKEKCHTTSMMSNEDNERLKRDTQQARLTPREFIFIRIKKGEGQGKEKCHTKSMMSNESNERLEYTVTACIRTSTAADISNLSSFVLFIMNLSMCRTSAK